jgi:hypothetical protein
MKLTKIVIIFFILSLFIVSTEAKKTQQNNDAILQD